MALNPSIILQGRQAEIENPINAMSKALTLKQMYQQQQSQDQARAEAQTMNDILKKNVVTDSSGKSSLNRNQTLSDLYKVNPEKAMALEKALNSHSLEELEYITKSAKTLAWSATPENWGQIRQKAIEMNLPNAEQLPQGYNPQFVERWQMGTLSGEEQLRQRMAQSQLSLDREKIAASRVEAKSKAKSGEALPLDQKKFVDTLATKNANKTSIKNQLDAFLQSFDGLSDDQKVVQSRQLLKTLNSPEGADAIGAEEAKRLGNLIEFKLFNLTEPGSVFGRDLEEFRNQVKNTSDMIGRGVESNRSEIDRAMGRQSSSGQNKKPSWAL